ncbi:MAG: excinuclease ABC subunit UvrB [Candidatus Aminicenantes bacterium]|nr:excinuclease ABC subunit UvrB [Candidatus Aminicenantes bacterium]
MKEFSLQSEYEPQGDQISAIAQLVEGLDRKKRHQVLMGVTGSGKTFTIANIIAQAQRPVLVVSHNKTLAAQLYQEFKSFFPENAVEYFVSYYDYYQPEAYVPASNTYIAKEATINDEIDRLRLRASNSLLQRKDVIIVASVSCIYGIGAPDTYISMSFTLKVGQAMRRKQLLKKFTGLQYERQETEFKRNSFRVRGDVVELFPSYEDTALRIQIEDDRVSRIERIDPLLGKTFQNLEEILIYPKSFFSTPPEILEYAVDSIEKELDSHVSALHDQGKILEANRIEERTLFDLEMLHEFGWCPGIENYSLYLSLRQPGQSPYTLMSYFPEGFLTIIDESHVTVPQIGGMYHGDRSRKQTLVEHGFRLPSALDNRPLNFQEFEERVGQTLYVSATPGKYEIREAGKDIVEQIIRPTGLTDPVLEVRSTRGQIDDLKVEIIAAAERNERTLVTTLTKKMAENLTRHYHEHGLRVRYLHSDIDTLNRVKILRDLRKGDFDALIGINLLREGLDLPEVSLVAILDADKEGFLRSSTSLIQTFGRAARNVAGRAILYADKITASMQTAIQETERRRSLQQNYNQKHNITPQSIQKNITDIMNSMYERDYVDYTQISEEKDIYLSPKKRKKRMEELEKAMNEAARKLEFEKAARYRDELKDLKRGELEIS